MVRIEKAETPLKTMVNRLEQLSIRNQSLRDKEFNQSMRSVFSTQDFWMGS